MLENNSDRAEKVHKSKRECCALLTIAHFFHASFLPALCLAAFNLY